MVKSKRRNICVIITKEKPERKDFSITVPEENLMEHFQVHSKKTIGVGKIGSIFNEQGLTESYHDAGNPACIKRTLELLGKTEKQDCFIFVNLVDTDMIYGHRRDVEGYYKAVEKIDRTIPEMIDKMEIGDVIIFTADHGCDPTFKGTDHTREYVPMLWYQKGITEKLHENIGIRASHADVAQSLTSFFGVPKITHGSNFYPESIDEFLKGIQDGRNR